MPVSAVRRRSCADQGAIPKRPNGRSSSVSFARRMARATTTGESDPCRKETAAVEDPFIARVVVRHRFLDDPIAISDSGTTWGWHSSFYLRAGAIRAHQIELGTSHAGDLANALASHQAQLDDALALHSSAPSLWVAPAKGCAISLSLRTWSRAWPRRAWSSRPTDWVEVFVLDRPSDHARTSSNTRVASARRGA